MLTPSPEALDRYAELLIRIGANLQVGQSLFLTADLEHAGFAVRVATAAYRAGARYVQMVWNHDPMSRARLLHSTEDYLDFVPEFDVARARQALDEGWARLILVGPSHPGLFEDVPPNLMRRAAQARQRKLKFFSDAYMANQHQWCIAGVPTAPWAAQVFPDLPADEALARLWDVVLATVRADQPDPVAAWQAHDRRLTAVARFLMQSGVRSLHFEDAAPGPDGRPSTDLVIGLPDAPVWIAAASATPAGVRFLPNMPTEEIFTTPHARQAEGYVRTSKPGFPFERRVEDAWFRFSGGEVVEYQAREGQEVLEQLFQVPGAQRLGELALVDVRSPVNQSGLLFYETLFDENCVCHMAFGQAYPEGVEHGASMTDAEKTANGINLSETHVDFMIGTPTLAVTGIRADGSRVPVLRDGMFVPEALAQDMPDVAAAGGTASP